MNNLQYIKNSYNPKWHIEIDQYETDIEIFRSNWQTETSSETVFIILVFATIAKRDFATIPSIIVDGRGQFTIVIEQIYPHKYITKRREKLTIYF